MTDPWAGIAWAFLWAVAFAAVYLEREAVEIK